MCHQYSGILFSNENEQTTYIATTSQKLDVKWKKQDTKDYVLFDSILEKVKNFKAEFRQWLSDAGMESGLTIKRHEGTFGDDGKALYLECDELPDCISFSKLKELCNYVCFTLCNLCLYKLDFKKIKHSFKPTNT